MLSSYMSVDDMYAFEAKSKIRPDALASGSWASRERILF